MFYSNIMEENKNEVRIIVDSGSILYSAINPNKELDPNGIPIKVNGKFVYNDSLTLEDVYLYLDNILIELFNDLGATHYIGFIDNKFSNSFRRKINSLYKLNRDSKEVPKYLREGKEYLNSQWNFIFTEGYVESDDLCKICHRYYPESILVSNDKDLSCTIGCVYNPVKKTVNVNNEYNEQYEFWKSMLIGDSSDNIKGCPKVGRVGAGILLDSILDFNDFPGVVFDKYIQCFKLQKGIEEFYKNYKSLWILDKIEDLPQEFIFEIPSFTRVPGTY